MNGNSILIETNIVLYLLSGDESVAALLDKKLVYLSFITEIELQSFSKISEKELNTVKSFLEDCIIIDINSDIKSKTIQFRNTTKLKLPDAIIAATSNYLSIPLCTADSGFELLKDGIDLIYYERG